jgi:hypothetical protein
MPGEDTLLDLAEMVEKIGTSALIGTMIDEYQQFLEENGQLELAALLPLMGNRKDAVNREYHELRAQIMRCRENLFDAMKGNEGICAALSALLAIIRNYDPDTKVIGPLRETFEEAKNAYYNLDNMCKSFLSYESAAIDYNVDVANEIHRRAKDFSSKNLFDESYLFNQFSIVIDHLSNYLKVLSASSRKQKTSSTIRQLLGLSGKVYMCIKQITKALEIRTADSPEIKAVVGGIEEKNKSLMKVMSALINSLYLCKEKEAKVIESVSIYKLFYKRGKKDLATKLEKQKIR